MAMLLRPNRGGFLRPFGCGWFIREFLLGHGPEGSPSIEPEVGACQVYYARGWELEIKTGKGYLPDKKEGG